MEESYHNQLHFLLITIPPMAADSFDLTTTSVFKVLDVVSGGSPTALLTLTPICNFIFSLGKD